MMRGLSRRPFRPQASRGLVHAAAPLAAFLIDMAVVARGRRGTRRAAAGARPGLRRRAAARRRQRRPVGRSVDVELVGIEVDAATASGGAARGAGSADPRRRRAHARARMAVRRRRSATRPTSGSWPAATSRGGRSALGGGPYADVAAEFLARLVDARPARRRPGRARAPAVRPVVAATPDPSRRSVSPAAAVVGFWWSPRRCSTPRCTSASSWCEAGRPQGRGPPLVRAACDGGPELPADRRRRPDLVAARGRPGRRPGRCLELDCDGRLGDARHRHRRLPPAVLRPRALCQRRGRRRAGPRDRPA